MSTVNTLRVLPHDDVELALAVERAFGAVRTPAEVARRFLVAENFVALLGDAPVGGACLSIYRDAKDEVALAWVGGMGVAPAHRRQGAARLLLDGCLRRADELGARCVGLDATPEGRPLYESRGFQAAGRTERWLQGAEGRTQGAEGTTTTSVHPISLSETMEIAAFDLARFGARRLPWLMDMYHAFPWQSLMARDKRTGDVTGYALRSERAMGPLVADSDETAVALLAAMANAGAPPRLVTTDANPRALALLARLGWARDGATSTRMLLQGSRPGREQTQYGLGSFALG